MTFLADFLYLKRYYVINQIQTFLFCIFIKIRRLVTGETRHLFYALEHFIFGV
jgi:hypothetical protein